jgi:hypothetical protein
VRTGEEEEVKSQLWTAGLAAADRKEDDEDALEKTALVSSSVRGRMLGEEVGREEGERERPELAVREKREALPRWWVGCLLSWVE